MVFGSLRIRRFFAGPDAIFPTCSGKFMQIDLQRCWWSCRHSLHGHRKGSEEKKHARFWITPNPTATAWTWTAWPYRKLLVFVSGISESARSTSGTWVFKNSEIKWGFFKRIGTQAEPDNKSPCSPALRGDRVQEDRLSVFPPYRIPVENHNY